VIKKKLFKSFPSKKFWQKYYFFWFFNIYHHDPRKYIFSILKVSYHSNTKSQVIAKKKQIGK